MGGGAEAVRALESAAGIPRTYFAAVVTPPELTEERVLARDVTLAIDVSASMDGPKFEQARAAVRWLLDHLRAKDRVNVIAFNDVSKRFADAPVAATAENLVRLRDFIDALTAVGGTALGDAIRTACAAPCESGRVAMVVILTDGLATVGEERPDKIVQFARAGAERGLRVHTFGVGSDVNGPLLEGVAAAGSGTVELFRPAGEVESRLTAFLTRTSSPAATRSSTGRRSPRSAAA